MPLEVAPPAEPPAAAPLEAPAELLEEAPRKGRKAALAAGRAGVKPATTSMRLWPDQVAALRDLANAVWKEGGQLGAPDMSALMREALDEFLSKRRKG